MPTTKEYIKSLIAAGDKRSYNEIEADIQLQKWRARFEHPMEYAVAKHQEKVATVESVPNEDTV